jgi:4-nitrophenyl phosphatase
VTDLPAGVDGIVCDLDGVLYRGSAPIAGAAEAVARMRERGIAIVFCTNNSGATVDQYVAKLGSLGVDASREQVVTSAIVTAEVLGQRGAAGKSAIVVGGHGLRGALESIGVVPNDDLASRQADFVVVGWDPSFDYRAMRRASMAVRAGACLVASNDDVTFPAAEGLWPGAGAILASIEAASGVSAEVMGKPHQPMMEAAARRLEGARHIAVVGDRADTDLGGAAAMGWTTVLVLSGVTTPEELPAITPRPDLVVESIADLLS